MLSDNHFYNSLLLLLYLITEVDGELDFTEVQAMKKISEVEEMPKQFVTDFLINVRQYKEKEVYDKGIEEINKCTVEEKKKIFAWLFKVSKVDGNVHIKEVRFLLYSVKRAGIDLDEVMELSRKFPPLF